MLPILTTAALVYVFYKSVSPLPDHPVAAGIWIAIGWAVVTGLYALAYGRRARDLDLVNPAGADRV